MSEVKNFTFFATAPSYKVEFALPSDCAYDVKQSAGLIEIEITGPSAPSGLSEPKSVSFTTAESSFTVEFVQTFGMKPTKRKPIFSLEC